MRILTTEIGNLHQDESVSAAEASGSQVPQAQLTAAPAAVISDPADRKNEITLQQQIRDLQRAAAMDMAPGGAPAEVPQTQEAG